MIIACARGVIIHEGKLLAVQQNGHYYWCLPGGKLDEGESIEDALKRELIEELGIEPEVGNLLYVHQFSHHDGRNFIEFFFRVNNAADYLNIDLSTTTHGEEELDAVHFINPRVEDMRPSFLSVDAETYLNTAFSVPQFRVEE